MEGLFENFFPFSDGLDLGEGLGDDLARELGWGASPVKSVRSNRFATFFCPQVFFSLPTYFCRNMDVDHPMIEFDEGNDLGIDFNFHVGDVPMLEDLAAPFSPAVCQPEVDTHPKQNQKRKVCTGFN